MAYRDTPPKTIYLKNYDVPRFVIDKTELRVELGEEQTRVIANLLMRRNPDSTCTDKALALHGQELQLVNVAVDGRTLGSDEYRVSADDLTIPQVPDQFRLTTEVTIKPQENTALEGLYKSRALFCTQCEAEGFRKITYYLDRPDVMAEFTTTIVADKRRYPVLLANGNPIDGGETDDGRHWATWHDPFRKPAHLFAMVAGDLAHIEDRFTTMSGREVTLRLFVEEKDLGKTAFAMAALKRAMKWDEEVFGREYDLDIFMIVAVDDFNMGAMENKGLNIFNASAVLASPDTTTDAAYQRIEAIVAHEYFHNWSGNRVNLRDWFQLSLKEGFTVFRDAEFSADRGSPVVKRVEDVVNLRANQFAEDSGPMAHPVRPESFIEISNFYTRTVYEKGAEVVRMFHTLLGPALFRKGCDLYFERHDGQAVTVEHFVAAMADVSGRDFSRFMNWYRQAGTPRLNVTGHYDAESRTYTLDVAQSCPPTPECEQKAPFHIPLRVGLVGQQGDLPLFLRGGDEDTQGVTDLVLEVTEAEQRFVFDWVKEAPVPSLLRNFSAPVKLDFPYSRDDLLFLMREDGDGFNRWEAVNRLALDVLRELIAAEVSGEPLVMDPRLVEAYRYVVTYTGWDPAVTAQQLTLPSEASLAEEADVIHVNAIHTAREFVRRALANALYREFYQAWQTNQVTEPYSPEQDQIERRSLKNTALSYLMLADGANHGAEALELARGQFFGADNMTDAHAALTALVESSDPAARETAEQALAAFYDKWQHEPLVVNQWFRVQAVCSLPGGLERVRALMEHEAFDIRNPNKVRAVIGAFSQANPVNFHRADGAGYRFFADQVLVLNKLNPQIAARLLAPLTQWRRYPAHLAAQMKAELERIQAAPALSPDVYEVVSKSLQ